MSAHINFEDAVEPMEWCKATYTVLRILPSVLDAIGPTKRVEGEINALRSAGPSDSSAKSTPRKQSGILYQVPNAKRAQTREKRIAKLLLEVSG